MIYLLLQICQFHVVQVYILIDFSCFDIYINIKQCNHLIQDLQCCHCAAELWVPQDIIHRLYASDRGTYWIVLRDLLFMEYSNQILIKLSVDIYMYDKHVLQY